MSTLSATEAADRFRAPPDDFLDVGSSEVAYRRVGNGPDVQFVHDWPVSGATFRLLPPPLFVHVPCHAIIQFTGPGSTFESGYLSGQQHQPAIDEGLWLRIYLTNNLAYRQQGWTVTDTGYVRTDAWLG